MGSLESTLAPFHKVIDELIVKGQTFKNIEESLMDNGYTGSASAIGMYTTRKRRLMQEIYESENDSCEFIERKHLIKLLYKPINKVKELSSEIVNIAISEYPVLSSIYTILQKFKETLFSKNPETLNTWIEEIKLLNILDINSFINGIENDIEGVKNSIIYEYSNGLAECKVNKIKVIKRIMYGRCKFETFKNKVLSIDNC